MSVVGTSIAERSRIVPPLARAGGRWMTRRGFAAQGAAVAGAAGLAGLTACGLGSPAGGSTAQVATCHSKLDMYVAAGPGQPRYESYADAIKTLTRPGCSVELAVVPSADLLPKLTTAVAGGTPPALTEFPPGALRQWLASSVLSDVQDLFKRDKLSKDDFPAGMWKYMSYGGKIWLLPGAEANADFILFWNKQHFREAGLDPEKGPATIADLDAMAQKLTREQGGDLERVPMWPWNVYGMGNSTQGWSYAMGGTFYDEQKDVLTFTHPRVQRAVEWMYGWAQRLDAARVTKLQQSVQVPTGLPFFASSKISIAPLVAVNLRDTIKNFPDMQIGGGPMPYEAPGKPGAVTMGGWVAGMPAGVTQRDEAWDVLKQIGVSDEGTTAIARRGQIPGYLKSPALAELSKDPLFKLYVDGVRRAEFVQVGFYAPGGWDSAPIQDAMDGKRSVRDALDTVNRDANQKYDDWKAKNKK